MTQATLETPLRQNEGEASEAANSNLNQIVSFQLGEEEFGLDIMKVQEIILVSDITKMPQVPEYVRGMINLRGHVIPVVDLRTRFNQPPCAEPGKGYAEKASYWRAKLPDSEADSASP